jgi:hypothetical protein
MMDRQAEPGVESGAVGLVRRVAWVRAAQWVVALGVGRAGQQAAAIPQEDSTEEMHPTATNASKRPCSGLTRTTRRRTSTLERRPGITERPASLRSDGSQVIGFSGKSDWYRAEQVIGFRRNKRSTSAKYAFYLCRYEGDCAPMRIAGPMDTRKEEQDRL